MPYPRFTKLIINHFLSQHKSLTKLKHLYINTIKDDGVLSRLKFVRTGEDFQEYGRAIPDTMLTEEINQDEVVKSPRAYQWKEREKMSSKVPSDFIWPARNGRRRPSGIAFRDNSSVSKKKLPDQSQKLRGIQTLTAEEQLAANTMQPLKVIKNISMSWSRTRSSSKGAGGTPEVPDNSTSILTTSSEGTGIKPGVPDKVKGDSKAKADFAIDWGSKNEKEEKQDDDDDDRSIDIKETDDDERTEDEFVHDDEEITNAAKTEATKGDYEQARKLPPTSSILSVSSGFGNQFLNLSSDISLIGTTKESTNTKINSLLDIQIQQEVPQIQSPSLLKVLVLVILEQTTPTTSLALLTKTLVSTVPPPPLIVFAISSIQQQTTPIPTPPITTIAPSVITTVPDPLLAIVQRVSELEKDVKELKRVDHYLVILATIRSEVSSIVNEYLGPSLGDSLQKSYKKHPAHQDLYDAFIKSLFVDENDMDQATVSMGASAQFKIKHDDQDEDYWELKFIKLSTAKPRVSTAQVTTTSTNQLVLLDQDRKRAKIIISDDEDDLEDPSKQGRKIAEIDHDPAISLDVSTAEKDVSTAKPVSTAGAVFTTVSVAAVSTASPTRRVSTADDITMAKTLVYIRKSATKDIDIQARVEADEELAQRLQAEEREMYTEAEQVRMLVELINQRKRYFATQRAEERRNMPPTQAQQRTYMSNYIKHIGSHTLQHLRGYSFDEIKTLFKTTMRSVNTFVLIESEVDRAVPELAAGSSKRDAEEELDKESSKRQKTGESSELAEESKDKEVELSQEELQQMMIIVPEDDLVMLWSLVKENFKLIEPTDDKEREIWVKLKRLFEPDIDDELWKLQKHIHDLTWRLHDSCRVHHVSTEKGIDIYMLVEKEYPLSRGTLTLMLVAKLLVEQDNEMSKELLRKIFM
ncbi:hypothetical protein Tco_0694178 [Tanacetum coccineum]